MSLLRRRRDPLSATEPLLPQPSSGTAQYLFKVMLRDVVSPALRAEGFTGSAGTYRLPSETHWALLGFQKSTSSDKNAVKFTINIKVISYGDYDALRERHSYYSEKPSPSLGQEGWTKRIGSLMPSRQDTWWTLRASDHPAALAHEALGAIRDYGLPALKAQLPRT